MDDSVYQTLLTASY